MEDNILKSIKKVLSIPPDYDAFDPDVIIFINSALSDLGQLGVGPIHFSIGDDGGSWQAMALSPHMLNQVKTYIYLKAKKVFDPPATSFHLEAMKEQIQEHEFRITVRRDEERLAAVSGLEN